MAYTGQVQSVINISGSVGLGGTNKSLNGYVGLGGGASVELDTTLTQSGKAADAKAVGDALAELEAQIPESGGSGGVYYVATNYGISAEAENNTPALQTLVDTVSAKGGGIIFFPAGTYNFKKAGTKYAVLLKSNVSIVGENIETTVFKQTEVSPYSMFYCMATATEPLTGCCFSNFTVDAYATGNTNQVYGKAFFVQYLRDCVFRDLRLLGTIATAMGIDYLDRVTIDNVSCVDCGRTFTGSESGTSGIGIGTGGWENENFTITNCICAGCGQYGIFIENQYNQGWGGNVSYAKGAIISNCVVRNGLNKGIGVRGGENITIIGCEIYENTSHGIYLDNLCKNVHILSCSATANKGDGINISPYANSSRIVVKGCVFAENLGAGIRVASVSDKLCISDNYTDENSVGLYLGVMVLNDCVLHNNTILDGKNISATFSGNTDYKKDANVEIAPTAISAEDISLGIGESATIAYSVTPAGSSEKVVFVSSNTSVATVSANGTVKGISKGSCQITITSAIDATVSTTVGCNVADIAPTAIAPYALSVPQGGNAQIMYEVTPANANRSVSYITSNSAIATVDQYGNVTGVSQGTCFVTITSTTNPAVSADASITVTAPEPVRIVLSGDDLIGGVKLMPNGSETSEAIAQTTDYLDVSTISGTIKITSTGTLSSIRVAQYDSDKNSLVTNAALTDATGKSPFTQTIEKLAGCVYIRIFYTGTGGGVRATVQSVVVEQNG